VFAIPPGCEVTHVSFIKHEIVFLLSDSGRLLSKQVMVLDPASKVARVAAEGNFDPGQRLEPIRGKEVLGLDMVMSGGRWQRWITRINLDSGAVQDLLELPNGGFFCVSPDSQSLFITGDNNKLQSCDLASLRLREVPVQSLPGVGRGGGCFLSNEDVLLCRELDAMTPLGIYKLSIDKGQAERVSKHILSGMRYSPPCPN
jgi:hypothetical protein